MERQNARAVRTDLFRIAFKRVWILALLLAIAGAVGGYFAGSLVPTRYNASAVVLVAPLEGNPLYPSSGGEKLENVYTEAEVVTSDEVASSVSEQTGTDIAPEALLAAVSTSVQPNTQVITITYEHSDKTVARRRAQAFADSYLSYRASRAALHMKAQISGDDDESQQLVDQLSQLAEDLRDPDEADGDESVLRDRLRAAAVRVSELDVPDDSPSITHIDPGELVTEASLDGPPLIGPREILAASGALAGIAVIVVFAIVSTRKRGTLRRVEELDAFNLRHVEMVYPDQRNEAAAGAEHHSNAADVARFRAQVSGLFQEQDRRISLISSVTAHSHLATTLPQIADAFAAAELSTVIIDASGVMTGAETADTETSGVAEVLAGSTSIEQSAAPVSGPVSVIGAGRVDDVFDENFFPMRRFEELLRDAAQKWDIVLVVCADVSQPLSQWLAMSVRAVYVEAALHEARYIDIRDAQDTCAALDAQLAATLVVPAHRAAHTTQPETSQAT